MERLRVLGDELEVHLTGADTGGTLCLVVDRPEPSFRLVAHRHRDEDETIHIVAGTFEVMVGDETRTAGPGDTVHVPRGTVHATRNVGDGPGHRVLAFHPAGIEAFFRAADGVSDLAVLAALAERHGWELVR